MLGFLRKEAKKNKFDRNILRKNNISILIIDERWNKLFEYMEKTAEIIKIEEKLRELLKEDARLNAELKQISIRKKTDMDKIQKLTAEVFDKNSEAARKKMDEAKAEIKKINDRHDEISRELENMPERIDNTNLELLEIIVNVIYLEMRKDQKQVEDLDIKIQEAQSQLNEYIAKKEASTKDYTDIYSYFHDLLGADALENLDKSFFGGDK